MPIGCGSWYAILLRSSRRWDDTVGTSSPECSRVILPSLYVFLVRRIDGITQPSLGVIREPLGLAQIINASIDTLVLATDDMHYWNCLLGLS